jgi:hypothetical protein
LGERQGFPRLCLGICALLALAQAQIACARGEDSGSRALYELERLSFVPAASCELPPNGDLTLSLPRSIVFDRFEFTRADLRHYWPERVSRAAALPWSTDAAQDEASRNDWPASVDFFEAKELAEARGMRLPRPEEWLHVAVGRVGYTSPWGSGREFFANTILLQEGQDFSLKSPCAVGTYENGRSRPFGCYDLLGNVWEWVDGVVLGCDPPAEQGLAAELDDGQGTLTSIVGGAFDSRWRKTFEFDREWSRLRFHARRVDKRTLSPSIGVRMCADAEAYFWARAPAWGEGPGAAERVRFVGARWVHEDVRARAALKALLEAMRARAGAPSQLRWLSEGVESEP